MDQALDVVAVFLNNMLAKAENFKRHVRSQSLPRRKRYGGCFLESIPEIRETGINDLQPPRHQSGSLAE
jgi:hypothetical protein